MASAVALAKRNPADRAANTASAMGEWATWLHLAEESHRRTASLNASISSGGLMATFAPAQVVAFLKKSHAHKYIMLILFPFLPPMLCRSP